MFTCGLMIAISLTACSVSVEKISNNSVEVDEQPVMILSDGLHLFGEIASIELKPLLSRLIESFKELRNIVREMVIYEIT